MILLRALFDVPKGSDDYKAIAKWVMTLFKTSNKLMYLMRVAIRQEVQCSSLGIYSYKVVCPPYTHSFQMHYSGKIRWYAR
jgi:hypothetical protein